MEIEQDKVEIEGEHTTATVMTTKYDENCRDQIQTMVDHPAFQNDVAIMPDTHFGAGAVIGFTMPIGERVVPNTVGVDIGCGMFALNIGRPHTLMSGGKPDFEILDEKIRQKIPMGRNVFDYKNQDYHIADDFPWDECNRTFQTFREVMRKEFPFDGSEYDGYGKDYFLDTCQKVGYDESRAINSIGTLGGGNHFIEINQSATTGDYWVVVHSGSRGIGLKIAKYWQEQAHKFTFEREGSVDIPDSEEKYFTHEGDVENLQNIQPDGLHINYEKVREDYEGEAIEGKIGQLQGFLKSGKSDKDDLDWLEGEEAVGYFIDMIFAQKYASESRKKMAYTVADVIGVEPEDSIESVHNYVDFRDRTVRKGATRAHEGERLIIPFNMRDGTIVCEGKGNEEWNNSAPHGAGRRMSRTRAFNELSFDKFKREMDGIFSTSVTEDTLDEAPMAYKDTAVVESVIHETAEVIDRWEPVHNIKAEE